MNTRTLAILTLVLALALGACTPTQNAQTGTNTGGNQTTIVVEGDNSGDITVIQGIDSNNNTNAVAATEAPAPAATEEPAAEADSSVCFAAWWHDGWAGGPARVNTTGTLNHAELEAGMSLQAPWDEWTTTTTVDGFIVPEGFETNNDALLVAKCGNTVFVPARNESSSALAFWYISYVKLTPQGLLICENDINTSNRGWSGECAGRQTIVQGIPLENFTASGDYQQNWSSLLRVEASWEGPTPQYGSIEEAWTSTK